jgi:tripartite-type tricarboxylate transporter receptor subunit TctC
MKRRLVLALIATVAVATPAAARYPERPISIIVPLPPGGPADTVTRVIAQKLQERLGQPVTVDNKPGALGLIAAEIGARAKPDGYTVVMVSSGLAIQVATQPKMIKFDVFRDLVPITYAVKVPMVVAAGPDQPFQTMREFVDYAKARPGQLSVGVSPGLGGTAHLTLERLKLGVGLDVVAVPYKGSAPALQALLSGEVPVIIDTLAGMSGLIDDGKIRPLAALTETPPLNHEKIPTIAAAGFPGYAADTWNGFVVPAGTPREIIDLLHREIVAILDLPDVKAKILAIGLEPATTTPEQFAQSFRQAVATWTKLADDAKLKFE